MHLRMVINRCINTFVRSYLVHTRKSKYAPKKCNVLLNLVKLLIGRTRTKCIVQNWRKPKYIVRHGDHLPKSTPRTPKIYLLWPDNNCLHPACTSFWMIAPRYSTCPRARPLWMQLLLCIPTWDWTWPMSALVMWPWVSATRCKTVMWFLSKVQRRWPLILLGLIWSKLAMQLLTSGNISVTPSGVLWHALDLYSCSCALPSAI